jgi:hypothetical protein
MPGPLSRRRRADRPPRPQHALRKVPERLQGDAAGGSGARGSAEARSAGRPEDASAQRDRDLRCAAPSEKRSAARETAVTACRYGEAASFLRGASAAHVRGGSGPDDDVSIGEPALAGRAREEAACSFQASRRASSRRDHGVRRVSGEARASADACSGSEAGSQAGRRRAIDDDVRRAAAEDPGSPCGRGADARTGRKRRTARIAGTGAGRTFSHRRHAAAFRRRGRSPRRRSACRCGAGSGSGRDRRRARARAWNL